ncbi:MAG: metallophosphoesterase [Deltaproteobacteria bacterium]|nr:metallophosphoesterase [Deltaproteobacteria bacterium]
MSSRSWVLAGAILAFVACKEPAPPPAPPVKVAPKAIVPPAPAVKMDAASSVSGQSDPSCVGPIDLSVPKKVTIAGKAAELNGYKLSFQLPEKKDQPTVFGVIGALNEDSGENLVNLKKYVEFFKAEKADAVIVNGDSGESLESIVRSLTLVAETGLPVFAVIGNRESGGHFNDALAALTKTFPNVVNLGRVRHVEFGSVDLISLPGYHDKRYLNPSGCQYFKQDVEALKKIAKEAKNPIVLVSHGPPHGNGAMALDAATEAGNVGDSNLNALIAEASIPFGVFSNIKEAGGRATDLEGLNVLKQDTLADRLFLNPGPADSVAWAMNDGTQSMGMAATLTVQGKQAKYRIFRAKALTAEEKTQAAKLAPERSKDEQVKDEAPKK